MRTSMYDIIKRQNGEAFAQGIRRFDNGLFEVPNLDKIVRYAGRNPVPILGFLESFKGVEIEDYPTGKNPFELLKMVGYDAFLVDSLAKQNSIASYFAKGEELCTFTDWKRFENYYVIHAVKEGARELKREDFKEPMREDEYGTSVISIQILKSGGFISIKNRYNHAVGGCDNTFSSNPDNIIRGLSYSLKQYFNVDFASTKVSIPNGYTYQCGQIFKYHVEKDNVYYGDDFCLHNGVCYPIMKDYQIFIGPYLLDLKEKRIKMDFPVPFSSMAVHTGELLSSLFQNKKLSVEVTKEGGRRIFADGKEVVYIKNNQVLGLNLYGVEVFSLSDLNDFRFLTSVSAPDAKKVVLDVSKFDFLKKCSFNQALDMTIFSTRHNHELRKVKAPIVQNLVILTPDFLSVLEDINTPYMAQKGLYTVAGMTIDVNKRICLGAPMASSNLKELVNEEFSSAEKVEVIFNGEDKEVFADGHLVLKTKGSKLKKIHLENAIQIPENTLTNFHGLEEISAPRVIIMQEGNVSYCPKLKKAYFPNLMYMDQDCFSYNDRLREVDLPALQEMGENSFSTNKGLKRIKINNLQKLPKKNILNNASLEEVEALKLEEMGLFCMNWLPNLTTVKAPNIKQIWSCCFQNSPKITAFDAPELLYLGDRCFNYPEFQSLFAPKLQEQWRKEYLPLLTQTPAGPQHICSANLRFQFSQKAHGRVDD